MSCPFKTSLFIKFSWGISGIQADKKCQKLYLFYVYFNWIGHAGFTKLANVTKLSYFDFAYIMEKDYLILQTILI